MYLVLNNNLPPNLVNDNSVIVLFFFFYVCCLDEAAQLCPSMFGASGGRVQMDGGRVTQANLIQIAGTRVMFQYGLCLHQHNVVSDMVAQDSKRERNKQIQPFLFRLFLRTGIVSLLP